jgi:hypothetical protein
MIHFAGVGTRIKSAVLRRKYEEEESKCVPWMAALLRITLPPSGTTQPPRDIRGQVRVNPTRSSRVVELEVRKMERK